MNIYINYFPIRKVKNIKNFIHLILISHISLTTEIEQKDSNTTLFGTLKYTR